MTNNRRHLKPYDHADITPDKNKFCQRDNHRSETRCVRITFDW